MLDDVGWKVWKKSIFIQHRPTLSNMFNCAVQTGPTCCIQQCLIIAQCLWDVAIKMNSSIDRTNVLT